MFINLCLKKQSSTCGQIPHKNHPSAKLGLLGKHSLFRYHLVRQTANYQTVGCCSYNLPLGVKLRIPEVIIAYITKKKKHVNK